MFIGNITIIIAHFSKLFGYFASRLEQAERELASVMAVLQEKQQKLADVEATIAKLEATYDASVSEKIELEDSIALTSARLARSASLTAALGDEQLRWESSVKVTKNAMLW